MDDIGYDWKNYTNFIVETFKRLCRFIIFISKTPTPKTKCITACNLIILCIITFLDVFFSVFSSFVDCSLLVALLF